MDWLFLPTLSERAKVEAAELIAAKLRRLAEGEYTNPATWHRVAELCGCRIYEYDVPGGAPGEYAPTEVEGVGVIGINTAYHAEMQSAVYIHEISHHELYVWLPPQLTFCADIFCYADDPGDVHHQIARMAEGLILGEE